MGYSEETHNKHWGETREIMRQIPKNNAIWLRTDSNWQPAKGEENKMESGQMDNRG